MSLSLSLRRSLMPWAVSAALLMAGTSFAQNNVPPVPQTPDAPSAKVATPQIMAGEKKEREGGAKNNIRDFGQQVFSPWTLILPAASAGISQGIGSDDGAFNPGYAGYGERFGVFLADNVESKFIRAFAMPTIFNQVEHYHPLGSGHSGGRRIGHALAHSFITKTRNGNNTVNMSSIPSSFAVASIGDYYYPGKYDNTWHMMQRAAWMQGGYFGNDLWTEFKPDICRAIHLPCGKQKTTP